MTEMAMTVALIVIAVIMLLPTFLAQYAVQRKSHDRALILLKQWLSPAQLACYEQFGFFEVTGSDSRRVFRIHFGTQANIEELNELGLPVCRWCLVPVGNLAAGDVMLAQKIALETNEPAALSAANRLFGPMNSRRVRAARRQALVA